MLDTSAGVAATKRNKTFSSDWNTKKLIFAAVIFIMPMGPLLLLAYVGIKHLIRKKNANKERQISAPTQHD